MYDVQKITDAIAEQVGFERSYAIELAPSLLVSKSGMTYNQGHPLLGYKNMADTIEELQVEDYPAHSEIRAYSRSEVVSKDGVLYQALGQVPAGAFDASQWEKTNGVSLFLKSVREQAASEVVSALLVKKQAEGKAKPVWEDLFLYEGAGPMVKTVTKSSRFVGFELNLRNLKDMALRVHAVGLQLTEPQAELPIYLYHSSVPEPLVVTTLAHVGSGRFSWHALEDMVLRHGGVNAPGEAYYIGYRESELLGAAVSKEDYTFGQAPCATCSGFNVQSHRKWSQFVEVHPFSVPESEIGAAGELWDISRNSYNYKTNFGLNLSLTLECDITDTIVRNARVFAEAQKLAVVEKILKAFVLNTRNNSDALMVRQMADYELNNRENHTDGLTKKKEKALQALDFSFSDLSPLCLPGRDSRISKRPM